MKIACYAAGSVGTNNYVVSDDNGITAIIDCDGNPAPLYSYIEKNNLKVTHILLTHGHYDQRYHLQRRHPVSRLLRQNRPAHGQLERYHPVPEEAGSFARRLSGLFRSWPRYHTGNRTQNKPLYEVNRRLLFRSFLFLYFVFSCGSIAFLLYYF